MKDLNKTLMLALSEAMLTPEQILCVSSFLTACRRMKAYLKKAESTGIELAWYGGTLDELPELQNEIERCIRNGVVDDRASAALYDIRRQILLNADQIKAKLNSLLRRNPAWFSESFVSVRNGHHTLPVKREHKNEVPGTLIDLSQSGGTCFIEPGAVGRLSSALSSLQIEEDSEVRRVLYTLTGLICDHMTAIRLNIETLETLDFLFAKGKLSLSMNASPAALNTGRELRLHGAKHPLLDRTSAVPLDLSIGNGVNGIVITGPNTGGKTVALKTAGLLSCMAQSGLHIPADSGSSICMRNLVLCDIGDGQSITENLSTFSSHMKNIIGILEQINEDSLVLLDELGSGTDPAEGMGLATAILDELVSRGCLFIVTTHYPEIKEYAAKTPGLMNARMAFDRQSLKPLYRLELGMAGESCALSIAERLGMPAHILQRAHRAAYGSSPEQPVQASPVDRPAGAPGAPQIHRQAEQKPKKPQRSASFALGDSVIVYPQKEIGIICACSNEKGELGVQIKRKKILVNHKRVKLHVPADKLYPENYDFSIIFDTVANRKARRVMEKRHEEGNVIVLSDGNDPAYYVRPVCEYPGSAANACYKMPGFRRLSSGARALFFDHTVLCFLSERSGVQVQGLKIHPDERTVV
jgi:dsDNA-specific endonuclease/ATPase MutS2